MFKVYFNNFRKNIENDNKEEKENDIFFTVLEFLFSEDNHCPVKWCSDTFSSHSALATHIYLFNIKKCNLIYTREVCIILHLLNIINF